MLNKEIFLKSSCLVSILVILGILGFVNLSAMAEDFEPTLDSLAGQPVAGSDPVEYYSQDLKSGYTATEITNINQNNLPANTITVYDFNQETREILPKYYSINLSKINYGDTNNYNSVNYYKFNNDNMGNFTLNNGTSDNYSIKYYVNSEKNGNRMTTLKTNENITKDFLKQSYISSGIAFGGAINNDNKSNLGDINGNFIGNYVEGGTVRGGAIYTYNRTIGDVVGDFIANHVNSTSSQWTYGGAIMSYSGKFGDIVGNYINNYAYSKQGATGAGALFFGYSSNVGDIRGDFIGNYSYSGQLTARGGAIQNYASSIANITGDFIGNYVNAPNNIAIGGAISSYSANTTKINNIVGNFISNYAESLSNRASGGAIDIENAKTNQISSNFYNNYANSKSSYSFGGAISFTGSKATTQGITGNFVRNYILGGTTAKGGAIYNENTYINLITANFIENSSTAINSTAHGGAIYNSSAISNVINSSFYNNYAKSTNSTAQGGAIWTNKDITITADNGHSLFSGNYTESKGVKDDNAIWVDSSSAKLNLTAKNNGLIKFDDNINGTSGYTVNMSGDKTGTISLYNDVKNAKVIVQNVTVDFANNETKNYKFISLTDNGNTKYNIDLDLSTGESDQIITSSASSGTITLNILNFLNSQVNPDEPFTFQILNTQNDNLQLAFGDNIKIIGNLDIDSDIVDNILDTVGNTVYNDEIYMQEDGLNLATTKTQNDSIIVYQKKLYNTLDLITTKDTTEEKNFIFRTADKYIASQDLGTVKGSKLNIIGLGVSTPSQIDANGHSLFKLENNTKLNMSNIGISNASATRGSVIDAINSDADITLENVSLTNNTSTDKGGAIFSNANINITANNAKVEYTGNKDSAGSNVIYLNNSHKTINVDAKNNASITFNDSINGEVGYDLNLTTDEKSSIVINNNIKNADININSNNIGIGSLGYLNSNNNSLSINGANFALGNLGSTQLHFRNFANTGNVTISNVNVDLINRSMGRIYADSYGDTSGVIDVQNLTLLNDAANNSTSVLFADSGFANSVKYTGSNTVAYSPIYTYNVHYSQNPENNLGYFVFTRGGGSSNPSDSFNPAVLPTAVTQQSGAYSTQMQTFHYAFQHAENFMNIPALDRLVIKNQNKYALSPTTDATDVGRLSPLFDKTHEHNGFWVKPYSSFESVPLKNGPKVSNINYGTLIGYDSNIKELKYGWDRVLTGYIGYNGASQRYKGIDTYQNGGILGSTITLYKGNFFNATTLSVGSNVGSTTSMFGHEDYTMLLGGIGNKTGYNFEFKDGRFIFQQSMLISYTFVNTFDYTNAAGVRIDSDPLQAIQLAPGGKFIMNTKNGWQPYMAVNMVWNALDKQKVMANDVRLPEMSIKPYVEYGMGVQRCFKNDSVTAFGQAMVRNGGRNGVSLTAGLRFKVGKDSSHNDKVKAEKIEKVKKENKKQASSIKKEHNKVPKVSKKITAPNVKLFGWSL